MGDWKDWIDEVVGKDAKVEKATETIPVVETITEKLPVDEPVVLQMMADVAKEMKQKDSLSQEKQTKEKAQKDTKEKPKKQESKRTVKLFLDRELREFDINEKLPEWFLQNKLKDDQKYIPINLYRDIMRQIWEFGIPDISDPEIFITGTNKSWISMKTYRVKCTVLWHKEWIKEPVELRGVWYSAMSPWTLLSDAVHGNMQTLNAKAMRDALKYAYKIFEFPEKDAEDLNEAWEIKEANDVKAKETIAKIAAETKPVEEKPSETKEEEKGELTPEIKITESFNEEYKKIEWEVTKKSVLLIGTELIKRFGEWNRPIIQKIITPYVNKAK